MLQMISFHVCFIKTANISSRLDWRDSVKPFSLAVYVINVSVQWTNTIARALSSQEPSKMAVCILHAAFFHVMPSQLHDADKLVTQYMQVPY